MARTYEKTHAFLKFSVDLSDAPPSLWIMLGECQSKCEHIERVPLRPDTAAQLYRMYLAKGVLATTAIEGNTLSEEEVMQHLQGKLKLPPSRAYLSQEIDNIVHGCNVILQSVAESKLPPISVDEIRQLNKTVLKDLKLYDNAAAGEIRGHSVTVGTYRGAPPEDCEYLLHKLCDWLNGEHFVPSQSFVIGYAILKAVLAHLYLAWIHPFGDGNGRTARLLEFQILITAGVPAASAHLLSNHYNLTRTEYYRRLDQASRSDDGVLSFITYAVEGLRDGLKQQIETIWKQQWDITWRNYVHEFFRDQHSETMVRRRHLVLDLSQSKEPVSLSALPEMSTRLAQAYARKTRRTLIRDVNAVVHAGLVVPTPDGYRANRELILAFLPQRARSGVDEDSSPDVGTLSPRR